MGTLRLMKNQIKIIFLLALSLNICASELTIPNVFVANTPAVAAQVNENFNAVESSIDDNDSRLDILEALVLQLQNDLNTANSEISQLQSSLLAVENNTVLELDGLLKLTVIDGDKTAEFTNVNIQLNSGAGSTSGVNGLGNLIIGYNEASTSAPFFCSDPQYPDSKSCIGNLETWAQNVRIGSHNLIVGGGHSYTKYSAAMFGWNNVSNAIGTLTAGVLNIANGNSSSITGGQKNNTNANLTSITGGTDNTANSTLSSITSGRGNTTNGYGSSITAGNSNSTHVNSNWSSVSGGSSRSTVSAFSWVGGSLRENN